MNSTRLFNENYFAFISVLDDLMKKNIKYVVLSGDFSDDGQKVHIEARFKELIFQIAKEYDMQILAIECDKSYIY